jgi:hypothetical protein
MRDFLSAWKDFRVNVDQYRELDDERVLALTSYSARGKKSGLDLGQMQKNAALLFQIRAGKVTRIVSYWDREDALADLGLASETDSAPSSAAALRDLQQRRAKRDTAPGGLAERRNSTQRLRGDVGWPNRHRHLARSL